ncbi:glycosyltransferase [Akkermansiaceae bacterium]|nr:glycosyltransferase [Akkermansiaceae bacterium]
MDINLTIAIPTCNRPDKLDRLLQSLSKQEVKSFKIIVVDSSEKFSSVCKNYPQLQIQHTHFPHKNLPLQRKFAIDNCSTDYLGFLDDDVTLEPNVVGGLVKNLKSDNKKLGGVTAWIDNIPTQVANERRRFRLSLSGLSTSFPGVINTGGICSPILEKPETALNISVLSGPCMFFKTDLIKRYGNLPELYNLYHSRQGRGEDAWLSGQLTKNGFRLLLIPRYVVHHHTEGGGSAISSQQIKLGIANTYGRYRLSASIVKNWSWWGRLRCLQYIIISSILLRRSYILNPEYFIGALIGMSKIFLKRNDSNG